MRGGMGGTLTAAAAAEIMENALHLLVTPHCPTRVNKLWRQQLHTGAGTDTDTK